MPELKPAYAAFMVHLVKAAIADGRGFTLYFAAEAPAVAAHQLEDIELDEGAIVLTFTALAGGRQAYIRYDQLINVSLEKLAT